MLIAYDLKAEIRRLRADLSELAALDPEAIIEDEVAALRLAVELESVRPDLLRAQAILTASLADLDLLAP